MLILNGDVMGKTAVFLEQPAALHWDFCQMSLGASTNTPAGLSGCAKLTVGLNTNSDDLNTNNIILINRVDPKVCTNRRS